MSRAGSEAADRGGHDRPLRILTQMVGLAPLGGVEVCTLQDSLALSSRGHQVSVLYGADGELRGPYEAAGVELRGPFTFSFDPRHAVRDLRGFLPAARQARVSRPDVVWLNRAEHLIWGQLVSRWARSSLVGHLHGPPVYPRVNQLSRGVAHFIAVSDFVRQAYLDLGVHPDRISRVYNAVPPEDYPPGGLVERQASRRRLGLPEDVPVVLCYGQMSQAKGVSTLVAAWREVVQAHSDAVLVLVDSMSDHPDPVVEAALLNLDPASYRKFPIADDVVPYLHACDVVAFPTLLPEAFGRVVLEGMSTGRPVVASRVGAVPEILSGPMSRFLVPPGSTSALAERLSQLIGWRDREPGLGEECVAWVGRHFPFQTHVDALESILQRRSHPNSWSIPLGRQRVSWTRG